MDFINQILGYPLGLIMWALYAVVRNYGVALFVFTLIIKLATFPLSLKQQKSTTKMALLQPQITDIQSRNKNNKEKLNEEMMAFYQKEGYNPMSGCLPLLIQMPILFGMIDVIYNPLKHIIRLPAEIIQAGMDIMTGITGDTARVAIGGQLELISRIKIDPNAYMVMGAENINKILDLNLSFLWMDLTQKPDISMFGQVFTNFNPVLLIPILSGISALIVSIQSTKYAATEANSTMKSMMYIMPVFSTWFAFSVASGVGLYWFFSNVLALIQTTLMNKLYNPKEAAAKAKQEMQERQEKERQEKLEAKKKLREASRNSGNSKVELDDEDAEKVLTAKEINRRKLAEARKRDAEKYGEEYIEVTDDDFK